MSVSVDDLPHEMIETIASNLEPRHLINLLQTSQRFRNLIPNPELYRMLMRVIVIMLYDKVILKSERSALILSMERDVGPRTIMERLDKPAEHFFEETGFYYVHDTIFEGKEKRQIFWSKIEGKTIRDILRVAVSIALYYNMRLNKSLPNWLPYEPNVSKIYFNLLPFPNITDDNINTYLNESEVK